MAGDWIKMRSGLLTNPKVIRMARILATDRFFMEWFTRGTRTQCDETVYEICDVTIVTRVTVGSLLSLWGAVNECASGDGFLKGMTLFEVDEMAGVPGFGEAMLAVGWVEEHDDGLLFPNFDEHNTVGKERSSGAKTGAQRTKEWRDRKAAMASVIGEKPPVTSDVTVTSQRDHREEKRREENKDIPPSAAKPAYSPGFLRFWEVWPASQRKEAKAECFKKWKAKNLEPIAGEIISHLLQAKETKKWRDGFDPAPLTYLNQHRWTDDVPAEQSLPVWET